MTIKPNKNGGDVSFPEPPMYFADQPAALMLGPLVSRITFGTEEMDDGPFPRPTVTIVMPTTSLLQFVNDIKTALEDPTFKKQSVEHLEFAARLIQTGGEVTPSKQRINMRPAKSPPKKLPSRDK